MRLGIYSNISRDTDYEIANLCASNILELGGVPVFEESFKDEPLILKNDGIEFGSFKDCDVIISIGGDGTLLTVVSKYREFGVPFVGINKGSIGFLTEIDVSMVKESIRKIFDKDYEILHLIFIGLIYFRRIIDSIVLARSRPNIHVISRAYKTIS